MKIKGLDNPSHTEKDFRSMSELAVKAFLNRKNIHGDIQYSLFNPSIADYILKEYSSNLEELKNIFKSLRSVQSLIQINSLKRESVISLSDADELVQFLFDDDSLFNKSYDYQVYLASIVKDEKKNKPRIIQILNKIIADSISIAYLSRFVDLVIELSEQLTIEDHSYIVEVTDFSFFDETDIKAYGNYIEFFDIDDHYILDHLAFKTESYLKEELKEFKNDVDVSKYVKYYYHYGVDDYETDERGLKNELHDMTVHLLNKFNSPAIDSLDVNVSAIIDEIDTEQMFHKFFESQEPYDDEGFGRSWSSDNKDIDDLFERT